jgi:hypothetical protein
MRETDLQNRNEICSAIVSVGGPERIAHFRPAARLAIRALFAAFLSELPLQTTLSFNFHLLQCDRQNVEDNRNNISLAL